MLSEIVNVLSPDSVDGSEDRRILATRLRGIQSTIGTEPVAEDPLVMFTGFERLSNQALNSLWANALCSSIQVIDAEELQVVVISYLITRLKLCPLQRLARLYDIPIEVDSSLNRVRRAIKLFVKRLRTQLVSRAYDRTLASQRAVWPKVVSNERKIEVLKKFVNETSSNALREFEVPLDEMDLNLLRRPDWRLVQGCVV
ncbi:hypothetical protein OG21DRAFT_1489641 [Imleria badia]|nr:hypothetical protein OG21DRAFT_1489641 [Imleria badia]